jgi:hypothetical protein
MLFKIILLVFGLLIIVAAVIGMWRTYKAEHGQNQKIFQSGTANSAAFSGEYQGTVTGYSGAWQGKSIDQTQARGINRFREGATVVERYPFATSVGKGLRDRQLDVIKLDYNQPGNPWWLKFIVDEVVEIAPATYLGKVHLHILPGVTFTAGYFTLTKSQ